MHFQPIDPDTLAAGSQRARARRYDGHPIRARREQHPTLLRSLLLLACIATLILLTAERVLQYAH
jgi:hypothetical protein